MCRAKSIIIIVALLFTSFAVRAQQLIDNPTLEFEARDSSLEYLIVQLGKKLDINFSYNPDIIPLDTTIGFQTQNRKLKEVLQMISEAYQLDYKFVEQQVILKPRKNISDEKSKPAIFTIRGHIKDGKTGESLLGATVYIVGTTQGTITNSYGFYSLSLVKGSYKIAFSFTGFKTDIREINLENNIEISIDLFEDVSLITEIVVKASESENVLRLNQMSEMKIKTQTLANISGFMGEPDLIKSFQLMPGIKLMGDGSTNFYVRGGQLDQNLILIDEAPIYNAAHLFGYFSVFVNNAIKDINIYKGDMPAQYGGRLSSLVDVKTRDGDLYKYHVYGNYGLISGNVSAEGPIKKGKSSFFLSARRSHIKWLLGKNKDNLKIYFYDINFKFNRKINHNNRIYFSAYMGNDYLSQLNSSIGSNGISWGNQALTLRWNHIFGERLFSNYTVNASQYNYFLYLSVEQNRFWNSSIGNGSLKADFSYYQNPKSTLKFGLQLSGHSFNPGNLSFNGQQAAGLPYVAENQANESVLYISRHKIINSKVSLRYGLRYTVWQNVGPTTAYLFNESHSLDSVYYPEGGQVYNRYRILEPRINLNCRLNEFSSIKASFVNTGQNIHMLSNSVSPFTSLEVWFPSGPNIKPGRSNQLALGYFRNVKEKGFDFSMEAFYKKMKNQIDYRDHARMLLNPYIEGELRFGTVRCYGVELSLKKQTKFTESWVSYTLSRSVRYTQGLNYNKSYPSAADKPHDFTFHTTFKTRGKWQFSLNWMYLSGTVFSSPTAFYNYNNYRVPVYLEKNNDRFPAYHRLDVSAVLDLNRKEKRFRQQLSFGLFNVYGRKNPIAVNFTKIEGNDGGLYIPANHYQLPETVATQLSVIAFMPSLTYSFSY